jgi:hypothetical protein
LPPTRHGVVGARLMMEPRSVMQRSPAGESLLPCISAPEGCILGLTRTHLTEAVADMEYAAEVGGGCGPFS